jgi:hypothetical protein
MLALSLARHRVAASNVNDVPFLGERRVATGTHKMPKPLTRYSRRTAGEYAAPITQKITRSWAKRLAVSYLDRCFRFSSHLRARAREPVEKNGNDLEPGARCLTAGLIPGLRQKTV